MSGRKTITRSITESSGAGNSHSVDRDNRVIRHVKILGNRSNNKHGLDVEGTDYSDRAIAESLKDYDERQVFIDHPPRTNPGVERPMRDLAGVIRNPVQESDGMYGDFHYRSQHAYLADDAEQLPGSFGFSHNATGSGQIKNGRYVIESIDAVRSVDLVTRPATTRGLFESESQAMPKTIREALESKKFSAKETKALLEMDGMDGGDAPMPEIAPDAASGGDYKHHIANAIREILADTSLSDEQIKAKVLALLKATNADEAAAPVEGETESSDQPADSEAMESLQAEVKKLRNRDAARTLCESEKFQPTAIQLKSLCLLESEAERKEFIAEAKSAKPTPPRGPRSTSSASLLESRQRVATDRAKELENFVASITS